MKVRNFTCDLNDLTTEEVLPVSHEDLCAGSQLLWEFTGDGYPVTVLKVVNGDYT